MIETGSLQENNKRLQVLHQKHDDWLRSVAYNLSGNKDVVDDLVQELYLYLGEKRNKKLYYLDSFNLKYCYTFLSSRWNNLINREKKSIYQQKFKDTFVDEYDDSWDKELERFEKDVLKELKRLEGTEMWPQAKIYHLYQFSNDTMEQLSKKVGISPTTTFLSVKKVKTHLKEVINKPKRPQDE